MRLSPEFLDEACRFKSSELQFIAYRLAKGLIEEEEWGRLSERLLKERCRYVPQAFLLQGASHHLTDEEFEVNQLPAAPGTALLRTYTELLLGASTAAARNFEQGLKFGDDDTFRELLADRYTGSLD
jgi:hypothetical protein